MHKILVIDDDLDICQLLRRFLTKNGFTTLVAGTGKDGLELLEKERPDLVMTDFRLGDMDGVEILTRARETSPDIPVIIITGYSDIRSAVNVMKMGALDYITKPLLPEEILHAVQKALNAGGTSERPAAQADENPPSGNMKPATAPLKGKFSTGNFIAGMSPQARNLARQVELVGPTPYSVIIYGESGSGKEAVARMIHQNSPRARQPFVAMDCGAISKDLANSELFGYEKGAFTGALATKIGHFELANGGTLFLDEVANLPYDVQVSLLRVVQERRLKRIGGVKEIDLDVRIIVASNERLSDAARNGRFREDLYHRFNEFSLEVPPLREREDDILLFAQMFLFETAAELGKEVRDFSEEVKCIFLNYPWYGNIRELRNVIKRATLLTDGLIVNVSSLPFEIVHHNRLGFEEAGTSSRPQFADFPKAGLAPVSSVPAPVSTPAALSASPRIPMSSPPTVNLKSAAHDAEYEVILQALRQTRFNKSKAASLLGIDRKTLYNKLKKYNFE